MKRNSSSDLSGLDAFQGRVDIFDRDWEVFVVFEDPATGKFKGKTLCCESASVEGCGENGSRSANGR